MSGMCKPGKSELVVQSWHNLFHLWNKKWYFGWNVNIVKRTNWGEYI